MRLGVVIPVYDQAAEIAGTIEAVVQAIAESSFEAEVIVVDDGSTDGSGDAVEGRDWPLPVRVVRQANSGRLAARRAGIEAWSGEWCLLLDSRVTIDPGSLRFVEEQLALDPSRRVWNAHVDIPADGNPYGVFWDVITRRAFAAYFGDPRTTSFGLDEFDRFPKGTTCFFAPREELARAFDDYRSRYADPRHGNDDTPIVRSLAAREPINISPGFRCEYAARSTLRRFVRHAFHRGTVFVDGHGRSESRFFPAVATFFPLSLVWLYLSRRSALAVAAPFVAASLGGAGLALAGGRPRQAPTLAWVTPVYAAAHALGMWRGLALVLAARLRR